MVALLEDSTLVDAQDMQGLIGQEQEVSIIEVEEEYKKIVLSITRAQQYAQLRAIHLGAVMWGEVRRIEEFGAFVGLDGPRISGLLHISNISRSRVETVDVSSPRHHSCSPALLCNTFVGSLARCTAAMPLDPGLQQ